MEIGLLEYIGYLCLLIDAWRTGSGKYIYWGHTRGIYKY
jgi:hypothetical protein